MLLPTPKAGFEPDWLLKLPPTSDKQKIYRVNLTPVTDVVVTQKAWTLREPWGEVESRLDKHFVAGNGWKKDAQIRGHATWQKLDLKTGQGFTVSAFKMDEELQIQTHTSRPLSWLEKTQRSLRKFFGVQEK